MRSYARSSRYMARREKLITRGKSPHAVTRIVLTGTACAGKSYLLGALAARGYRTFPEAETPIVRELRERLGPEGAKEWILGNYTAFKGQVGERQREIDAVPTNGEPVFYDRSAACYIGYCMLRGARIPEVLLELSSRKPDAVFFLERLARFKERRDTGRFMSEEEACRLAGLIEEEYARQGVAIMRVPEFSPDKQENVERRVAHIEAYLTL